MAPTSTTIYFPPSGYDVSSLQNIIDGVLLERDDEKVSDPLRTEFRNINNTNNGFSAAMRFEVPKKESGWDGAEFGKTTHQSRVRFTNSVGDGGMMIFGKSDLHNEIQSRLDDLLYEHGPSGFNPGELEQIEIDRQNIEDILESDRLIESRATYKSLDENTSSASLAGRLEESDTAERFEERGNKVWVIYESESYDRKVGLTSKNNAAVFYGDWNNDEMAIYWYRIILNEFDV